jgi:serine/threonine protein kinase
MSVATVDNMPKALFGFDVIDFIGEGAGSAIYAVNHPSNGQLYALKYVRPKTDKEQRFIEQLEAEHEVGKQVQYAGLRRTIELMTKKTLLRKVTEAGLLMELFDGIPLERRLPKTMGQTIDVFIQTARALEALHHMGYIHCDLKPNNILVDSGGQVKVIDLGQACKIGTSKSRIQGTPDFIAPEQVKCEACTARTDVFNFGATMYWTLSGSKLPTLFTVGKKENSFLLDTRIPTPRDLNAQVPEVLSNLVMECVRTSPARRPSGMMELARRLEIIQHAIRQPRDPKLSSHGSRSGNMAGAGV